MKRRTLVRILTFSLAALALAAGFAVKYAAEARAYRRAEIYGGYMAMSELADAAEDMSKAFEAGVYARSPGILASLSNSVWRSAAAAIEALSRLPVYDARIDNTRAFLSRAGDYAAYLSRAAGGGIEARQRAALAEMAQAAHALSGSLRSLESDVYAGNVLFSGAAEQNNSAVFRFSDIEKGAQYPSPEYEGLMAESRLSRAPSALADAQDFAAEDAEPLAAQALACEEKALVYEGESGGRVNCHVFRNGSDEVRITRAGGLILTLRREPDAREAETAEPVFRPDRGQEEALVGALAALGFPDMVCVRAVREAEGLEAECVSSENGVRCDADTVRVRYTEADGIVQLNASGYIENHHVRGVEPAGQSASDALPQELSMEFAGCAVIDPGFGTEYLCREYRAQLEDGRTLVIFCDADSGVQRKIEIVRAQG